MYKNKRHYVHKLLLSSVRKQFKYSKERECESASIQIINLLKFVKMLKLNFTPL